MVPRKLVARAIRALPLLLIPVIVAPALAFWLQSRNQVETFQASATIWVLEPDRIQNVPLDVPNPYLSPAGRQAAVIGDLLRTDSFRLEIAEEAGLTALTDPTTGAPLNSDRLMRMVSTSVEARTTGSNLLEIAAQSTNPERAVALVDATVLAFQRRLESETARQSTLATEYFSEQLVAAENILTERQQAVDAYLRANPGADNPDNGDREYARLATRLEMQTRVVEAINASIQESHMSAVAASQALAARFNVVDPAALSTETQRESLTRRFGMPMAAGLMGAMVSAGFLLVLFYTDHSVYSREDLSSSRVRFLGYAPRVRKRRGFPGFLIGWLRRDRHHARRVAAALSGKAAS